jgi:LysR family hydrogen peroxide-inducible transcriptional activator
MEMHQLHYFVKVAELGSFTRAAEASFVSQPALSQAIAKLEKELKQPLFERLGRKVLLTDAGRLLLDRAQRILALADDAQSRIADLGDRGRVTVAAIPTVAPYLLPPLLTEFTERYPEAEVEVREEVTDAAVRGLLAGEVDVALLALPLDGKPLEVEPLCEEELLLVMPPGHPLEEKKRITLKDLKGERFVLLNEAHCLSEQVVSFCRQKAFQPIGTNRTNQLATVQELVALGQGVSLVPAMAARLDASPRRVYRSLSGEKPQRTLALAWHRDRYQSQLVKRFIEAAREFAAKYAPAV